jgi:hypothetical protein
MFDLNYNEWKHEFNLIVEDTYGITAREFCDTKILPNFYNMGYSPIDTFIELEEEYE